MAGGRYTGLRKQSYKFSNWLIFAEVLYEPEMTEEKIIKLLQMEILFGQRQMIIKRLYSRFSRLRYLREKQTIFKRRKTQGAFPKNFVLGMTCWDSINVRLKSELSSIPGVKLMLLYEQTTKARPYMIKLLYGRFTALRRQQELEEISTWRHKQNETLKST